MGPLWKVAAGCCLNSQVQRRVLIFVCSIVSFRVPIPRAAYLSVEEFNPVLKPVCLSHSTGGFNIQLAKSTLWGYLRYPPLNWDLFPEKPDWTLLQRNNRLFVCGPCLIWLYHFFYLLPILLLKREQFKVVTINDYYDIGFQHNHAHRHSHIQSLVQFYIIKEHHTLKSPAWNIRVIRI